MYIFLYAPHICSNSKWLPLNALHYIEIIHNRHLSGSAFVVMKRMYEWMSKWMSEQILCMADLWSWLWKEDVEMVKL